MRTRKPIKTEWPAEIYSWDERPVINLNGGYYPLYYPIGSGLSYKDVGRPIIVKLKDNVFFFVKFAE